MDDVKLLPCPTPWCDGGEPTQWTEPGYWELPQSCPPRCRKCGVSAPSITAWNTRISNQHAPSDVVDEARLFMDQRIARLSEISDKESPDKEMRKFALGAVVAVAEDLNAHLTALKASGQ